jgi:hypothetical protein
MLHKTKKLIIVNEKAWTKGLELRCDNKLLKINVVIESQTIFSNLIRTVNARGSG